MSGDSNTVTDPVLDEPELQSGGRRAFWTFVDQALSSLTNAALTIVVAREVGVEAFGAFALALVTYGFVVGFGRSTIADPYVIRFAGARRAAWHPAIRQATGGAFAMGLIVSAVCFVAGLVIPEPQTRGGLWALAIVMPALLVQDTYRYAFFAAGRPAAAALNDAFWAVLQFSTLAVLLGGGVESVFWITMAWGLSGAAAALLGIVQLRALPAPGQAVRWYRLTRDLNVRMGIDYALNMGAVNLATYVITAIVGLAATAALRAAQTLIGPLFLFRSGLDTFVLPILVRLANARKSLISMAALTSAMAAGVAAVWVAILVFLPTAWGEELLGANWDGAAGVMLGYGAVTIAVSVALGSALGMKALRRPDLLLRGTLIQAPLIFGFGCIGAWLWGAPGAANGFGIAQIIGAGISWWFFLTAHRGDRDWIDEEQDAADGVPANS